MTYSDLQSVISHRADESSKSTAIVLRAQHSRNTQNHRVQRPHHSRLGLNGLLNPPTRFMYCRYSVFFSLRTPDTSFPGTFVFFVVLNPPNPIVFRIIAPSGSSSASVSTCIFSASSPPPFESAAGFDEGCEGAGLASLWLLAGLEGSWGFATRAARGGERARVFVLVLVPFRAGERERVRCRSGFGGGSSRGVR